MHLPYDRALFPFQLNPSVSKGRFFDKVVLLIILLFFGASLEYKEINV